MKTTTTKKASELKVGDRAVVPCPANKNGKGLRRIERIDSDASSKPINIHYTTAQGQSRYTWFAQNDDVLVAKARERKARKAERRASQRQERAEKRLVREARKERGL